MPTTTAFSGGAINYDDADKFRAQQIKDMQDYAMRMALQNSQGQQARLANQDTIAGNLAMNGTLGQKTSAESQLLQQQQGGQYGLAQLGNKGALDVANVNSAPQMMYANTAAQKYGDERPGIQAANAVAAAKSNLELGALNDASGDPSQGSPSVPGMSTPGAGLLSPANKRQIIGGVVGVKLDDPQQAATMAVQQALQAELARRLADGDQNGALAIGEALKSGDISKIPAPVGLGAGQQEALRQTSADIEPDVKAMEGKIGGSYFDITDNEMNTLHQQALTLKAKLDNARLPPAAKSQLMQAITTRLTAARGKSGFTSGGAAGAEASLRDILATIGAGGQQGQPMQAQPGSAMSAPLDTSILPFMPSPGR